MPLSTKLDRKLQPVEDESDDSEYYEISDRSSPSIIDTGDGGDAGIIDLETEDEEDDSENESNEANDEQFEKQLSKVSFGALAKAQDAISKQQGADRKRKRGEDTTGPQEDKLQALRERLREIKAQKAANTEKPSKKPKTAKRSRQHEDEDENSEGESSESDGAPHARSSKHAPAVQSSKRAVTRRRDVVDFKKSTFRDPRFDKAGPRADENTLKKRYGFLDDYKTSEMAELKTAIKKTKNEDEKEKLKRKLMSMESQKKAQDRKDKLQDVAREHKKKEKELIKQGKQPFYLKKSEQKNMALVDKFQNMKSKDRDRLIERRRKKATAKERRNMPAERRAG